MFPEPVYRHSFASVGRLEISAVPAASCSPGDSHRAGASGGKMPPDQFWNNDGVDGAPVCRLSHVSSSI